MSSDDDFFNLGPKRPMEVPLVEQAGSPLKKGMIMLSLLLVLLVGGSYGYCIRQAASADRDARCFGRAIPGCAMLADLLPGAIAPHEAFYNPGTELPYHTGGGQNYESRDRALMALAHDYGQTREWVAKKMGTSNDLEDIRKNLITAMGPINQEYARAEYNKRRQDAEQSRIEKIKNLEEYDRQRYAQAEAELDRAAKRKLEHARSRNDFRERSHELVDEAHHMWQSYASDVEARQRDAAHEMVDDLTSRQENAQKEYRKNGGK